MSDLRQEILFIKTETYACDGRTDTLSENASFFKDLQTYELTDLYIQTEIHIAIVVVDVFDNIIFVQVDLILVAVSLAAMWLSKLVD